MIVYSLFGEMVYSFKYNNGMQNIEKGCACMPWERKTVDEKRKEFVARAVMGEESISALVPRVWDQPTNWIQVDRALPERGKHV